MLIALRLPSFHRRCSDMAKRANTEGWPAARLLAAPVEIELAKREIRRIRRNPVGSHLPSGTMPAMLGFTAIFTVLRKQVEVLAPEATGSGTNIIAIGNSGAGRTHLICATGHALIEAGHRALCARIADLMQRLQAVRRDLALEAALAMLDKFDLLILR